MGALQGAREAPGKIQGIWEVAGCFDSDGKNSNQQVALPIQGLLRVGKGSHYGGQRGLVSFC